MQVIGKSAVVQLLYPAEVWTESVKRGEESPHIDLTERPAEIRTAGELPNNHQQPLNVDLKEKTEN